MFLTDKIREWLDKDKSVRMVADDLQLTSEMILLVRMMFADGELKSEELVGFKNLCRAVFGIPDEDVPQIIGYLREFGYETSTADAAQMFKKMDVERKKSLLLHLLSIAKADGELHEREMELIRNTADILGLGPDELTSAASIE